MPRAMRADYAGAFHHVTNRGNHGAEVFRDDEDRRGFLAQLAAVIARQGWRCQVGAPTRWRIPVKQHAASAPPSLEPSP